MFCFWRFLFFLKFYILPIYLVNAASKDYLSSSLRNYFSDVRHHTANQAYKKAAKQYVFDQFVKFGLEAEYFNFSEPTVSSKVNFTNVIGVLKGLRFGTVDDRMIGICAHYDTVAESSGVDDNGSGVVAMLEVARQLSLMNKRGVRRKNTILFAAFDLEEYGLYGSEKLVNAWVTPWSVKNYGEEAANELEAQGVFNLDGVMAYNGSEYAQDKPPQFEVLFPDTYSSIASDNYKGDFLAVIYREPTRDKTLAKLFETKWRESDRKIFELELLPLPFEKIIDVPVKNQKQFHDFMRSDHGVFWENEIPAVWITDTMLYRNSIRYCYHRPCDNLTALLTDDNLNFLGKTADVTALTIHDLSEPILDTSTGQKPTQCFFSTIIVIVITMCIL